MPINRDEPDPKGPIRRKDWDYPDRAYDDYDTEFATEVAPTTFWGRRDTREQQGTKARSGTGLGVTSIILSLLAFFVWPFALSVAGIIVGIVSIARGSSVGWWGVSLGVVAMIIMFVTLPFRVF